MGRGGSTLGSCPLACLSCLLLDRVEEFDSKSAAVSGQAELGGVLPDALAAAWTGADVDDAAGLAT
jgi:hypothetical protein